MDHNITDTFNPIRTNLELFFFFLAQGHIRVWSGGDEDRNNPPDNHSPAGGPPRFSRVCSESRLQATNPNSHEENIEGRHQGLYKPCRKTLRRGNFVQGELQVSCGTLFIPGRIRIGRQRYKSLTVHLLTPTGPDRNGFGPPRSGQTLHPNQDYHHL